MIGVHPTGALPHLVNSYWGKTLFFNLHFSKGEKGGLNASVLEPERHDEICRIDYLRFAS